MSRWCSVWRQSSGGLLVPFESFDFVTGLDNSLVDSLSPDVALADLGIGGLIDFGPYLSSMLLRALEFCSPQSDTASDEDFFEYWGALRTFLNEIVVPSQSDCATILGGPPAATGDPNTSRLTSL